MEKASSIKIKRPAYTKDTSIYRIEHIPKVYIPLGEDCVLTAKAGERVLVGQSLGISTVGGSPLFSSVSGRVVGCVSLNEKEYIEIENDGADTPSPDISPCGKRLSEMQDGEIIDRIRRCAIKDWERLSTAKGKAKRFVLNCLDTDPYSSDKKCAVTNFANQILGGAKIILKLLGLRLCEIVIEKKNTDQTNLLIDCIGSSELFDIIETNGKYPSSEEKAIITRLPDNENLVDGELFILDACTSAAIYRAFSQGMPYVRRTVSIGGSAVCQGGCYDLPIGTPIKYISEALCEPKADSGAFSAVIGGVMKGRLSDAYGIIEDGTHALAFIKNEELYINPSECIGCEKCDKACPEGLLPSVFISRRKKSFERAIGDSGMDKCTDCGACGYICPANIQICELAAKNTEAPVSRIRYKKQKKEKAPFISSIESTRSMNLDIIIVLCMLLAWSIFCFGAKALLIVAISVVTAVSSDVLFRYIKKSPMSEVLNLSSVSCGLLGALTLSVRVPLYLPAVTAFFSVAILRGVFGGYGKNLFHSAFGARVLASLIFHDAFIYPERNYTAFDYIIGNTEGALGEISVILLLAALVYLCTRGIISPVTPALSISAFATVTFLIAPAQNAVNFTRIMLIGSAILFVLTFCGIEYSTIPKSRAGKAVYGALLGALAAVVGRFTSYEGAYVSALAASCITPLFNRFYTASGKPSKKTVSPAQDAIIPDKADAEECPPETNDEGYNSEQGYSEIFMDYISPIDNSSQKYEPTDSNETPSKAKQDFSQTMEFSDEKADELLELLAKEIGLNSNTNKKE